MKDTYVLPVVFFLFQLVVLVVHELMSNLTVGWQHRVFLAPHVNHAHTPVTERFELTESFIIFNKQVNHSWKKEVQLLLSNQLKSMASESQWAFIIRQVVPPISHASKERRPGVWTYGERHWNNHQIYIIKWQKQTHFHYIRNTVMF